WRCGSRPRWIWRGWWSAGRARRTGDPDRCSGPVIRSRPGAAGGPGSGPGPVPRGRARSSVPVEDAVPVLLEDAGVPLVAAVHVAGAQQRGLDAAFGEGGGGGGHHGLEEGRGDDRGRGGERRGDVVEGELRVADRDLGVQYDVAVVLQEGPRGVPRGGL